ncbi:hypothetical protein [Streptosporangium sp. NPDC001681]|uniref:hypothetical protein n=1 Tax=Streptosporangium sp. NPDC001681 TaxID=3154395 RepID=UPI00332D5509
MYGQVGDAVIGTTPQDMAVIGERTPHVFCKPAQHGGSGDSSPAVVGADGRSTMPLVTKLVLVVRDDLEPALMVNAAGGDGVDASGRSHAGLNSHPVNAGTGCLSIANRSDEEGGPACH